MAYDAEFESNIENVYKRAVLDNMANVGINQSATASDRYAQSNAVQGQSDGWGRGVEVVRT